MNEYANGQPRLRGAFRRRQPNVAGANYEILRQSKKAGLSTNGKRGTDS